MQQALGGMGLGVQGDTGATATDSIAGLSKQSVQIRGKASCRIYPIKSQAM